MKKNIKKEIIIYNANKGAASYIHGLGCIGNGLCLITQYT